MGFYLVLIRNYSLAALYLFVVVGAIYGLFAGEISIFDYKLIGWQKNLLCLSGLFFAGVIAAYPIVLALYRAFTVDNK